MIHTPSTMSVVVFAIFVAFTLGLSFYFAAKTKSAAGYFAAGGQIHWFVNGVAFAGDYLSAASFLGICGLVAFYGYDGFLYSIGYLAGWVVALFVVAEPLKRLGKYTFADALNSKFQSRGITLSAGISTLVVSVFYLIPQMVGAGSLIKPLLGFPHEVGVVLVGVIVVLIVATAGMVSTTYVQFIKGSLLVVFSSILTVLILQRGISVTEHRQQADHFVSSRIGGDSMVLESDNEGNRKLAREFFEKRVSAEGGHDPDFVLVPPTGAWKDAPFVRLRSKDNDAVSTWYEEPQPPESVRYDLVPAQTVTTLPDGRKLVNGLPRGKNKGEADLWPVGHVRSIPGSNMKGGPTKTGPLGPAAYLSTLQQSEIITWSKKTLKDDDGSVTDVYFPKVTSGASLLRPGNSPTFKGLQTNSLMARLDFISLMLALFAGTASLPHILIRYYTVKDQAAARLSTVVGIATIGFFYVLTLFLGLGAMTSGTLDLTDSNMAAPLLAKGFGELLFAIISAIAFTTVLGTVSGLIVAASGAVVHDLLTSVLRIEMSDHSKVRIGKIAAVVVGVVAIALGILFKGMNASFLVGWAFSVAASANLPALVMLLFWKGTTKQGITAAIFVGMISSLSWILLSAETFEKVYKFSSSQAAELAWVPFSQPGLVTIPLGFLTLIVVSLATRPQSENA